MDLLSFFQGLYTLYAFSKVFTVKTVFVHYSKCIHLGIAPVFEILFMIQLILFKVLLYCLSDSSLKELSKTFSINCYLPGIM